MKTQIIALETHDDFISVRDRMSWAKSPRILLVWPKFEKIALRAADLRILQQHASYLGAELGVITRRGDVRRDAERFGIPVFRSAAAAQRQAWPKRGPVALPPIQRQRRDRRQLEAMRDDARSGEAAWRSRPLARIGLFIIGVVAVMVVAGIFVPTASITLVPASQSQDITLPVTAGKSVAAVSIAGSIPTHELTVTLSRSQSARVATQASIPDQKAHGIARFTNLTQSDVTVPAGTIVYSLSPTSVQFATVNGTHLPGNVNAIVEVPIAAVNGGAQANLPANAIQAIQGNLGLSAAVTNPQPITGGTDRMAAAPSDADRQRLKDVPLEQLRTQAQAQMSETIGASDVVLPASLTMGDIVEETYDPPAGKPGNLLKLTLRAAFSAQYVKGDDLAQLVEATLDAAKPSGYVPAAGSMTYDFAATPTTDAAGLSHFELRIRRQLLRDLDLSHASALVRGKSPEAASRALQGALPLAKQPEIKLSPAWWPWLPLVPFRITVAATP